jgi:hypothetical protein
MEPLYTIRAWTHSNEGDIIRCIQEVFLRKGYKTKNFHADDRIHELGVDLECRREYERVVFAVKKKPKKKDIKQLETFVKSSKDKKGIYVYVEPPTRPFEQYEKSLEKVTFWDASRLHAELVKNESIYYLCLLFSAHPVADALTKVNEVIYEKRKTSYLPRKLTTQELDKLWVAKDNIVKTRSMLLNAYTRWTKKLMAKSSRDPEEYQAIVDEIFEELDVIDLLSSEKLVSSFVEIADMHPDLFGLYWNNVRKRTNWKYFVVAVEKHPEPVSDFIRLRWVIPRLDTSSLSVMRGFYSGINYILENFHTVANNLEDGIDWVFEDMRP